MTASNTATTGAQAYATLETGGEIKAQCEEIYAMLETSPDFTAAEIFHLIEGARGTRMLYDSNTRARFTELVDVGAVEITGARECMVTGARARTYRALPRPWTRPATPRKERSYKTKCAKLEATVEALRTAMRNACGHTAHQSIHYILKTALEETENTANGGA